MRQNDGATARIETATSVPGCHWWEARRTRAPSARSGSA